MPSFGLESTRQFCDFFHPFSQIPAVINSSLHRFLQTRVSALLQGLEFCGLLLGHLNDGHHLPAILPISWLEGSSYLLHPSVQTADGILLNFLNDSICLGRHLLPDTIFYNYFGVSGCWCFPHSCHMKLMFYFCIIYSFVLVII